MKKTYQTLILFLCMLLLLPSESRATEEITHLYCVNGSTVTKGEPFSLEYKTTPETIQNTTVIWEIKADSGTNARFVQDGTHILADEYGMFILCGVVTDGNSTFTRDIPMWVRSQDIPEDYQAGGFLTAVSPYQSAVGYGDDPVDNPISFSYSPFLTRTLYDVLGYLDGPDKDAFTIISAPPSEIYGDGETPSFVIQLNENMPVGRYDAQLKVASGTNILLRDYFNFYVVVTDGSPSTSFEIVTDSSPQYAPPSLVTNTGNLSIPTIADSPSLGTVGQISTTENYHNYSVKSMTQRGNLVETSNGYCRIEHLSAQTQVSIEYYNHEFQLIKTTSVPVELSSYVAFHEGEHDYYLMFADRNTEESDSKEVIRVVKYDKYWNRLASTSISGINTAYGVEYADMVESQGKLLIHSQHSMYASGSDGLNHQANMQLVIDIATMSLLEEATSGGVPMFGYVSHSFHQLIDLSPTGIVYTADHGDAYPRSLVAFQWNNNTIADSNCEMAEVFGLAGTTGNNATMAHLGGLQVSSRSVLLVGSSVTQDTNFLNNRDYNVFVTSTPQQNFSQENTSLTWLTSYDGTHYASNPWLIELNQDRYLILWNELPLAEEPLLFWTILDEEGNPMGDIRQTTGALSNVEPRLDSHNKVVWYSNNASAPVFYCFDVATGLVEQVDSQKVADSSVGLFDSASTWAQGFLQEAYALGLLENMEDLSENYGDSISREEFCRLMMNVYRSTGNTAPSGDNPFSDTTHPDVISAYGLQIVSGTSATTFSPHASILRQELATMVLGTASLFETIPSPSTDVSYLDKEELNHWAIHGVVYAQEKGFLSGSEGYFYPNRALSREEAVIVAYRMAEYFS